MGLFADVMGEAGVLKIDSVQGCASQLGYGAVILGLRIVLILVEGVCCHVAMVAVIVVRTVVMVVVVVVVVVVAVVVAVVGVAYIGYALALVVVDVVLGQGLWLGVVSV